MNAHFPVNSVLLADDHPMLLKGLSAIVAAEDDFEVVGTALDGDDALAQVRSLQPQLAVLDLAMPRRSGLDILKAIAHEPHPPRVVILTAMISDQNLLEAIASGVWGILLKESAPEALIDCLRGVLAGQRQLPADLVEKAFARNGAAGERLQISSDALTARERQIAMLVSEGRPNVEIAEILGLSAGTVRIHLHNIYTKLNIRNRTALAALVLNSSSE